MFACMQWSACLSLIVHAKMRISNVCTPIGHVASLPCKPTQCALLFGLHHPCRLVSVLGPLVWCAELWIYVLLFGRGNIICAEALAGSAKRCSVRVDPCSTDGGKSSRIGQSLVLATVFNAYKRQNIRQFKQQFQSARMRALDRSFRALLAASPQQPGDGEQVPVHVFEQFCGHEYMQHALFREHPLLLRQLADANDDGGISGAFFQNASYKPRTPITHSRQ